MRDPEPPTPPAAGHRAPGGGSVRDAAARELWSLVDGDESALARLRLTGPGAVLPSSHRVTDAAAALVGVATLAVAEVGALRSERPASTVETDSTHAALAFRSERHLRVTDRAPRLWDGLSGYYKVLDGWVQFHTNFDHHRAGLVSALGLGTDTDRAGVESIVREGGRFELEDAVTVAGGVAAAIRTEEEWRSHPHGLHGADGRPVVVDARTDSPPRPLGRAPYARPLLGIRVLDLTRVIAGPVCTRTLAAYGADVLRVGSEGLPVVDSLLPDTTLGKRFCHVDITTSAGRDTLLRLAAEADVVVAGFRPGALAQRGVGVDQLLGARADLVVAELSTFGTTGPWGGRRGFDSITQSATGIVDAETTASGATTPQPLPCQLLDHGSGFLLTLGVLAALTRRHHGGGGHHVSVSLLQTRNWLTSLGRVDHLTVAEPDTEVVDAHTEIRSSTFGRIGHITHPGTIPDCPPRFEHGPTRPGADQPEWLPRS